MIEVMTDLPDRVLGLNASGEVTANDYKTVLVPAIEEKLTKHKKVRLLYVFGDEFTGIAKAGGLNGLMVVAEHFPGWDDFAALSSHVRFVREHHKKIRRVAIVTADRLVSALPRIASRFLDAEVRAFPVDERDEALLWVGEGPSL